MLDPLYLRLRPGRSRHPTWAKSEKQRKDKSPLCETTCPGSLHTRLREVLDGAGRAGAGNYLISTLAPASSNFFLIAAASSLLTPSLTVFGAPSTRSLASFRPRLVTSRTALMTLILLPPTSVSTTENSVFSSAGAAPPAAAPPPPAATTVAAAAE